ncbi:MAG: hypothetical protein KY451_10380 [Actinobacteria bacterium]|nr:hypothetical protein [Actinomycetota bacterium]MBW3648523.1 hypothetical protein [Actinomycetota bacterium]
MRASPLLSAAAATALLAALAAPATAAAPAAPVPGLGTALSSGSLAKLSGAGKSLEALRLQLPTGTLDGTTALVKIIPLLSDDVPVGSPIEVGAGQEKSFPSRSQGVPGVLSLTSPSGSLSALVGPDGPVAKATAGLGNVNLIGMNLLGNGSLAANSQVGKTGSAATKQLNLAGLELPALLDLLGVLGLDLEALPVGTLPDLLDGLDLISAPELAQLESLIDLLDLDTVSDLLNADDALALLDVSQLDAAQIDALQAVVGSATEDAAVDELQKQVAAAEAAAPAPAGSASAQAVPGLDSGALDGALGGVLDQVTVDNLVGQVDALDGLTGDPLTTALDTLITDLEAALDGLLGQLDLPAIGGLPLPDLLNLLDVPLLELGALDVKTLASSGATDNADVTGKVEGLNVLGTDLLGSGPLDIASLLGGGGLGQVQSTADGLLKTVTDTFAVGGLVLPLPKIEILRVVEENLSEANGTKTSRAGVEALSLTWALDTLNIPANLSLTDGLIKGGLPVALPAGGIQAAALPTGVLPAGQLTSLLSEPLSLVLGDLTDTAVFKANAATPSTVVPVGGTPAAAAPGAQLPRTGASAAVAVLGVVLMGAAVIARRRHGSIGDPIG